MSDNDKPTDDGQPEDKWEPPKSKDEDVERINKIVQSRLAQEREQAAKKYAGFDDYKAKAEEFDKAAEAAKTDQEKAVAAARKEGEAEATKRADARVIGAEARAAAAAAKFRDAGAAVKLADLSKVTVGDDGEVDSKALDEAIKAVADAYPYMVDTGDGSTEKAKPKPDKGQGGTSGGSRALSVSAVMEERRAAREAKASA